MSSLFLSISPESLLLFLLLGCLVGLVAGLFGVGGGLVIVPALIWGLPQIGVTSSYVTHLAVGTSLATIVVTSLSSIRAHHKRGAVDWSDFRILAPGLLLGAWLGGIVAGWLEGEILQRIFGLFALIVGARMLLVSHSSEAHLRATRWIKGMTALVIGVVSAVVGIGGGSMTVPFLHAAGVEMKRAVATSSACGLPIALSGAASFMVAGWGREGLPPFSSGYIYWPVALIIVVTSTLLAPVGAALAHKLPERQLKRVFALFLMLIGIKLLIG